MARKPLLTSPTLDKEAVQSRLAGAGDVMSRIIDNDRAKRTGSPPPAQNAGDEEAGGTSAEDFPPVSEASVPISQEETPKPLITNVTTLQGSLQRSNERTKERTGVRSQKRPNEQTNDIANEARSEDASGSPGAGEQAGDKFDVALLKAKEDAIAVVTVRAPERFNTYVDRWIERYNRIHPRAKYRKQDAVAEMFAWFYANHPMPPIPEDEDDL